MFNGGGRQEWNTWRWKLGVVEHVLTMQMEEERRKRREKARGEWRGARGGCATRAVAAGDAGAAGVPLGGRLGGCADALVRRPFRGSRRGRRHAKRGGAEAVHLRLAQVAPAHVSAQVSKQLVGTSKRGRTQRAAEVLAPLVRASQVSDEVLHAAEVCLKQGRSAQRRGRSHSRLLQCAHAKWPVLRAMAGVWGLPGLVGG
ncbi:hypothetical protein BC830DRAFT_1084496 [Chytriomyces sp. MP71]|nr:hypothetical protein BC830DRAFT_1084496 [Chytriomyces sp. MP71]